MNNYKKTNEALLDACKCALADFEGLMTFTEVTKPVATTMRELREAIALADPEYAAEMRWGGDE